MILDGVFDLHVHSGPDIFPRLGDDLDFARACVAAGMDGFAIKTHHESSVARAHIVTRVVEGFTVVGGLTLNRYVGGFNATAVDQALRFGARVIWGPSGHAHYHEEITGELGGWGKDEMRLGGRNDIEPITALASDSQLSDGAMEILALVRDHGALFCTSHLSPTEIRLLVEHATAIGARILINHVFYFPRCNKDFVLEMADAGAFIEVCAALAFPHWGFTTYDQIADLLKDLNPRQCVIASDCGGVHTPWPHEALSVYADELARRGTTQEQLGAMMRDVPKALAFGTDHCSDQSNSST